MEPVPKEGEGSAARIEVGAKVKANYQGKGKHYPGQVKKDNGDGTYDIDYDDGESESRVAESNIKVLGGERGGGGGNAIDPVIVDGGGEVGGSYGAIFRSIPEDQHMSAMAASIKPTPPTIPIDQLSTTLSSIEPTPLSTPPPMPIDQLSTTLSSIEPTPLSTPPPMPIDQLATTLSSIEPTPLSTPPPIPQSPSVTFSLTGHYEPLLPASSPRPPSKAPPPPREPITSDDREPEPVIEQEQLAGTEVATEDAGTGTKQQRAIEASVTAASTASNEEITSAARGDHGNDKAPSSPKAATFTLSIPTASPDQDPDPTPSTPRTTAIPATPGSTVATVEDTSYEGRFRQVAQALRDVLVGSKAQFSTGRLWLSLCLHFMCAVCVLYIVHCCASYASLPHLYLLYLASPLHRRYLLYPLSTQGGSTHRLPLLGR